MKGKCFSAVNRGQRKKSDFYETPYSMTEQLLEVENFEGLILEPACGDGAISTILIEKYSNDYVTSIDINQGFDFLNNGDIVTGSFHNIITNPPFSLAHEFIQKAKSIYTDKIAFLLPLSYLHGQKRFEDKIFSELKCIHIFTRYPMLGEPLREDGKYHTGMVAYAWYIWKKEWEREPVIRWINNQKYVLSKGDEK